MKAVWWQWVLLGLPGLCSLAGAQPGARLQAFLDVSRFWTEEGQPYLEIVVAVHDSSLGHVAQEAGGFRSAVRVKLQVQRQSPDSLVLGAANDEVQGRLLPDTSREARSYYILHQWRFPAQEGSLRVVADLADPTRPGLPLRFVRELDVQALPSGFAFSDLKLVSGYRKLAQNDPGNAFAKHGVELKARPTGASLLQADSLLFYAEMHGLKTANKGKTALLVAQLRPANLQRTPAQYTRTLRWNNPSDFDFVLDGFRIADLPSQTYTLLVEAFDANGERLGQTSRTVYIFNPVQLAEYEDDALAYDQLYGYDEVQLDSFLTALGPIMTDPERGTAPALKTFEDKKRFFTRFWAKRRTNPAHPPGHEWFNYLKAVRYADQNYRNSLQPGWLSDRGRTLLRNGPPNHVERFDDPLIFEVWTYDRMGAQNGVIFVFRATDRATNVYYLVHSTAKGEIFDPSVSRMLESLQRNEQGSFMQTPVSIPNATGSSRFADE